MAVGSLAEGELGVLISDQVFGRHLLGHIHQLAVQQGHPQLQGVGHGHLVGLEQDVPGHPLMHVQVLLLLELGQAAPLEPGIDSSSDLRDTGGLAVGRLEQPAGLVLVEDLGLADEALLGGGQVGVEVPGPVEVLALGPASDGIPGLAGQTAQETGDILDDPRARVHAVVYIACEELVGALPAQDHAQVPAGQLGKEEERHAGGVGVRFVHVPLNLREVAEGLVAVQGLGGVVELEYGGQLAGLVGFVVGPLAEAD